MVLRSFHLRTTAPRIIVPYLQIEYFDAFQPVRDDKGDGVGRVYAVDEQEGLQIGAVGDHLNQTSFVHLSTGNRFTVSKEARVKEL